jgi:protein TonB
MYADRHLQQPRFNPAGLTAAIAINAAFVAALMFTVPGVIQTFKPEKPLTIYRVPIDPPPPPEPTNQPIVKATHPIETIDAPIRRVPTDTTTDLSTTVDITGPTIGLDPGPVTIDPPLPPAPLPLVDPAIDSRYAGDFQPAYPAAERRAGREGRVTVRVLVGIDGRVKDAQRLTATSDDFWQATLNRALAKWRFRPGTRGGVPVEAWRTLTLTFVLKD